MEPIIGIVLSGALVVTTAVFTARAIHSARRARRREQKFKTMIDLANEALQADLARSFPARIEAVEVDPESPLGRQLAKMLGPTPRCGCPNCEEERRIKHAQSKRDGE